MNNFVLPRLAVCLLLQGSSRNPLLVLLESHVVVLNRLREVPFSVLRSSPCIGSIDVVGIESQDLGEVLDGDISLLELVVAAAFDVESPYVEFVELQQSVTVSDGFLVKLDFEVATGTDE